MLDRPGDDSRLLLKHEPEEIINAFGAGYPEQTPASAVLRTYVKNRELARLNKEAGLPWPWCEDPIIQQQRFTNIFRETDRESKNYINRVVDNAALTFHDKRLNALLFRLWNRADVFDALGGPWTVEQFATMDDLRRTAEEVTARVRARPDMVSWYTNAFMVSGIILEAKRSS